jgi:hypothetical protein
MGYQVFSFYESTLILLLNARTIISFAGIVLLVVGNWSWNRSWELYRPPENPPRLPPEEMTTLPFMIHRDLHASTWWLPAVGPFWPLATFWIGANG